LLTDGMGLPLVVQIGPANQRDDQRLPALLDAFPKLQGPRGRPRSKPSVLQGDAGYGFKHTIRELRARRIRPLVKRRGDKTTGSGLGRTRYVVEQALSWFNNCRRLRLCYERTPEHFQAFHDLAATLICARRLWGPR
jgi:transposase